MNNYTNFIKDFQFYNGELFTGSWESVVNIFSHITSNVNFVETHVFLEFQNTVKITHWDN